MAKQVRCPVCRRPTKVSETKGGRPMISHAPCGFIGFVNADSGVRRLRAARRSRKNKKKTNKDTGLPGLEVMGL